MISRVFKVSIGVGVLVATVATHGAHAADFETQGRYVGGAFVFASGLGDEDEGPGEDAFGGSLHWGYRGVFVPWLATEVEVEYVSFEDAELTFVGDEEVEVGRFEINLMANLKAYPLQALEVDLMNGRVQPFGLLGVGLGVHTNSQDTPDFEGCEDVFIFGDVCDDVEDDVDSGALIQIGAGADVYITNRFSAFGSVTYDIGTGDIKYYDVISVSVGAQFHF
jgi:hypothetical protein